MRHAPLSPLVFSFKYPRCLTIVEYPVSKTISEYILEVYRVVVTPGRDKINTVGMVASAFSTHV